MMQTISENDLFHRLTFDNPWWEFRKNTKINFRKPTRRSQFDDFVKFIKQENDTIKILAGPLRAGKSVMLKQLISGVIEAGMSASHVFYCSLATPSYVAADPLALLEMFCEQYRHKPEAVLLVIFDEVQYIKNWREMLLQLKARHPGARIIGSLSADAPAQSSGARDETGSFEVFVLPPLTFAEFLKFRDTENKLFVKSSGSASSGKRVMLRQNAMKALNEEFQRYVNYGGFLEGVLSSRGGGAPAPSFIRDGAADRVLHKDLSGVLGISDPEDLNKLFSLIAFNTARELSIDDLAKATGIAKNTIRKYLDFLEKAFLIWRIPRVDRHGKRFERAVAFKVYLTTPCLYAALFGPVLTDSQVFSRLAETAFVGQWLGSEASTRLAYGSWRGGAIDLMLMEPGMDGEADRPAKVYDMDWDNRFVQKKRKPTSLISFVERTNRQAKPYILNRDTIRPASMKGIEITLAPLSLYTYLQNKK